MNTIRILLLLLCIATAAGAQQSGTVANNIKVDQFGYYPAARKVAVIAKPISGFNLATEGSYNPSTAANGFQVRRWSDNGIAYTGTLTSWNSGATHSQSGDKGWWFDFTTLTTPGTYYVYDVANSVRSYPFEISSTVYNDALRQALRVFFYQRINGAKQTPYADTRWADGAAFGAANQDYAARSLADADPKDLSGGWMDAGDYNKYTTFAADALLPLLESYRSYPSVFGDANNIPESGNGVPDLLDEVKWEIDWYKRMQDATGTRGLFLKVGVTSWNSATPPSTDANPRYYVGECTSATISGAAVFALASIVYRSLGGSYVTYADDLLERAKDAWTRVAGITSTFTTGFETACDNQVIKAGDADVSEKDQKNMAFTAAVYLYEATGSTTYKTFIESQYTGTYPYTDNYWGPYYTAVQKALLRYAALPTTAPATGAAYADATIANAIRTYKASQDHILSINSYNSGTDLYRAYMPDGDYAWGSNRTKCYAALHNYDFLTFNINSSNAANYKEAGESYLHYLHGVNPLGMTMLVNMYEHGGDNCANEMSHAWFRDGTIYDNALTSAYGPPPGYLTGGANQYYWVSSIAPPYGQLPQKAYKDWNTDWNNATSTDEASYSITEPSISNQAAYVSALARVIATSNATVLPVDFIYFTLAPGNAGAFLQWRISNSDGLQYFVVERSTDGRSFTPLVVVNGRAAQLVYTYKDADVCGSGRKVFYRVKAVEAGRAVLSPVRQLKAVPMDLSVSPNPASGSTWLQGRAASGGTLAIRVLGSEGQVLLSQKANVSGGSFRISLSLAGLLAGMYWVQVSGAGSEESIALLKRD